MFEVYHSADENNISFTTLNCNIYTKNDSLFVDFIQANYSDLNKWEKPKVLTDLVIDRFAMPEIYSHISSKNRLRSYITRNIDDDFTIIDKFAELAKFKQHIVISLPTTMYSHRRGLPTNGFRKIKDTFRPLIVDIDGRDVSHEFVDFGDFEDHAVRSAYQALVCGHKPKTHHKHMFMIDGVMALHDELNNNFMEK